MAVCRDLSTFAGAWMSAGGQWSPRRASAHYLSQHIYKTMQILLASAKIMNSSTAVEAPLSTTPRFVDEARRLVMDLCRLSVDEIARLLGCSEAIARENYLRYRRFDDEGEWLPAVLAYHGQAYKYLRADELTADDLRWAQDHLWMTSFLYGLLRPLDRIHPYRMEGGVRLAEAGGDTLFAFWRDRLTDELIRSVQADDGVLLHLATEEMEHLFDWRRVEREVRVVQPLFYADQGDRLRAVSVHAKSCRGAMAREAIVSRAEDVRALTAFSCLGYAYRKTDDDPRGGETMLYVKTR